MENVIYIINQMDFSFNNKLKEYFDSLLGYNLYDLFPEIKNNL